MSERRVFLAGEGAAELGDRVRHPSFAGSVRPGVIEVLLRRLQPEGWQVGGAVVWRRIKKLRVGRFRHADTHNVLGAALRAKEAGCEVLAFTRDRDNDDNRVAAVERGIEQSPSSIEGCPAIVGGVAVPKLEGWLLALEGQSGTEKLSPGGADKRLAARLGREPNVGDMVRLVDEADFDALPLDAKSLRGWLDRGRAVLCSPKGDGADRGDL